MNSDVWASVPPQLAEAEVGFGELLADGGSSSVFTVLGERKGLLYKKYKAPHTSDDLNQLVRAHSEMDTKSVDYVRLHLAWPVTTVCEGHDAIGALVVRAVPEFQLTLPSGRPRVRDVNFLLYEKRAERLGVARATDRQKVELLSSLVNVLSWLDDHGFVHEDLAAHNVLWKLNPPAVFLLDCDSLRPLNASSALPLYTTVDWTDTRVLTAEVDRPDRASTSYVLGLLAVRVLVSPYWHPGDALPIDGFPTVLTPLVTRAVGPAGDRPPLTEWYRALDKALTQTTGTVVEPAAVGDPEATQKADRVALLLGLLVGAVLAVFVLLRFL